MCVYVSVCFCPKINVINWSDSLSALVTHTQNDKKILILSAWSLSQNRIPHRRERPQPLTFISLKNDTHVRSSWKCMRFFFKWNEWDEQRPCHHTRRSRGTDVANIWHASLRMRNFERRIILQNASRRQQNVIRVYMLIVGLFRYSNIWMWKERRIKCMWLNHVCMCMCVIHCVFDLFLST